MDPPVAAGPPASEAALRLEQREARLALVEHIARRALAGAGWEELLGASLRRIRNTFATHTAAWAEREGSGGLRITRADGPHAAALEGRRIEPPPAAWERLAAGGPWLADDPDGHWLVAAPVRVAEEVTALVLLSAPDRTARSAHHEAALIDLAALLSLVAQRGRAERDLEASRSALAWVADHTPGVLFRLRLEGGSPRFELVSRGLERFLGSASGDRGRALWEALEPADAQRLARALASPEHSSIDLEMRLSTAAGSRWVRLVAQAIVEDGERLWSGLLEDVHEARETFRLLNQTRQELAATIDAVPDAILLEDREGRVVRANRAAAALGGHDIRRVIGLPIGEMLFDDEDDPRVEAFLRPPRAPLELDHREELYEAANYPLEGSGRLAWVHVLTDVTERARRDLESRRFVAAIEQSVEATVVLSGPRIVYANHAARELSDTPLVGRSVRALGLRASDRAAVTELIRRLGAGKTWSGPMTGRGRDGEARWYEVVCYPIWDAESARTHAVVVAHDTTDRRRLEALQEAVSLMDNIGFVFSAVRHELGNPINSVKTAVALVRRKLGTAEPALIDGYLERVQGEIRRMEYLLHAFKSFNMFENPRLEPTDLVAFVVELPSLLGRDLAARGVELQLDHPEQAVEALVDSRALHQIVLNLVTNAADALVDVEGSRIMIAVTHRESGVDLVVSDNGCGMSAAELENAFRPFYTSKAHGTGLGLAIVQRLALRMGGSVRAASEPGVGTSITVSLALPS